MSTYTQHPLSPISLPFSPSPSLPSHQQPTKPPISSSSPKPISISHSQASWIESLRSKSRSNLFREAISTYIEMIGSGVSPDNFAFPAVLKAVAGIQELYLGKQIHAHVFKFGYGSFSSVTIDNTLVNMYSKCGGLEWEVAIKAFRLMLMEGFEPSSFTLVSMALACSNLRKRDGLWLGKQIHGCCFRKGHWKTFSNNALMAMYAKLGRLDDAKSLLVMFEDRDLVTWNSMISSFSQNERFMEALMFLRLMVLEGVKPDGVTFASVLPACSHLELLRTGKEIHAYALRTDDVIENSFVGSALVDMYCNCGQVESGRLVFDGVLDRKIGLWNAMITGYAQSEHDEKALMLFIEMEAAAGLYSNATTMSSIVPAYVRCEGISRKEGKESLELFEDMVAEGAKGGEVKPTEVTFIALFAACSHSGMVDEGLSLFHKMKTEHGIEPAPDHYACIVDLVGRAGKVEEAYGLVNTMPSGFDKVGAWSSLLGACRIHHNIEIGEIAAENLLQLQPDVASHYVLLSNIYSSAGLWDKAMNLRRRMKAMGVKKEPGCSWIEYGDEETRYRALTTKNWRYESHTSNFIYQQILSLASICYPKVAELYASQETQQVFHQEEGRGIDEKEGRGIDVTS
ncbi:hypothetical protein D5086_000664 [Populus alba]|uniref:Uncharacterized protein n=1 Tax=Populus alba TaxID=43335 RepID=A0ACC4CX08_POPAL